MALRCSVGLLLAKIDMVWTAGSFLAWVTRSYGLKSARPAALLQPRSRRFDL